MNINNKSATQLAVNVTLSFYFCSSSTCLCKRLGGRSYTLSQSHGERSTSPFKPKLIVHVVKLIFTWTIRVIQSVITSTPTIHTCTIVPEWPVQIIGWQIRPPTCRQLKLIIHHIDRLCKFCNIKFWIFRIIRECLWLIICISPLKVC